MGTFLRHCEAHHVWQSSMKFLYFLTNVGWYTVFIFPNSRLCSAFCQIVLHIGHLFGHPWIVYHHFCPTLEHTVNVPARNIPWALLFISHPTLFFCLMLDYSMHAFSTNCLLFCLFAGKHATSFLASLGPVLTCQILPLFQIIRHFGFPKYVVFAMHIDIHYV
jgi:hypothetical protein